MFPGSEMDLTHCAIAVSRSAFASRTSLGSFLRSSVTSAVSPDCCSQRDVFPLPPPPCPPPGPIAPSGRARERVRVRRATACLAQLAVACLNWLVLGQPSRAPPGARVSDSRSSAQEEVLTCIYRQVSVAVRTSRRGSSDLGRALSKLCSAETSLRSLGEGVHILSQTLIGSSGIPTSLRNPSDSSADLIAATGWPDVSSSALDLNVQASRIKWELPPSFDPRPFLPADLSAYFDDPELLRLASADWVPDLVPAKVHATRPELELLLTKLDAAGALILIDRAEVSDWDEACGLFRVPKDADHDRLILNPTVINSRMETFSRSTKRLGVGFLLTRLDLEEGECRPTTLKCRPTTCANIIILFVYPGSGHFEMFSAYASGLSFAGRYGPGPRLWKERPSARPWRFLRWATRSLSRLPTLRTKACFIPSEASVLLIS